MSGSRPKEGDDTLGWGYQPSFMPGIEERTSLSRFKARMYRLLAALLVRPSTSASDNVHSTSFGTLGEGYIRLSYATSTEQIEEALFRMNSFLIEITAAIFANALSGMATPGSAHYMALVSMVALLTAGA